MFSNYCLTVVAEGARRLEQSLSVIGHTLTVASTVVSTGYVSVTGDHSLSVTNHLIKVRESLSIAPTIFCYIRIHNSVLIYNETLVERLIIKNLNSYNCTIRNHRITNYHNSFGGGSR